MLQASTFYHMPDYWRCFYAVAVSHWTMETIGKELILGLVNPAIKHRKNENNCPHNEINVSEFAP